MPHHQTAVIIKTLGMKSTSALFTTNYLQEEKKKGAEIIGKKHPQYRIKAEWGF